MSQTRAHPRAPIELRVAYQRMNAFLADYTRDISKGGVFIKTTTPFPIGTEFDFHISLPKRPEGILLKGRVVWVVDGNDPAGASQGAGAGMGIQFVWARDEERARFEKLVEDLMIESFGEDLYRKMLERGRT